MHPTIQNATITNWVTDLGEDGMYFYTLTKYWSKHHNQEDWDVQNDLEVFLECRSYTGPAPRTRNEYKFKLTHTQYIHTLYTLENSGPEVVHNHIERKRASWDTIPTSVTLTSS
jgi:hypothetical protein